MASKSTEEVTREFIERLLKDYPSVQVKVSDEKWSTEDVTIDLVIPHDMTPEEEDVFLDARTRIAMHLYDTTDVYVLAVAHRSEEP